MPPMGIVASAPVLWRKNLAEAVLYPWALPVSLGGSGLLSLEVLPTRLPLALEASGEAPRERAPSGS